MTTTRQRGGDRTHDVRVTERGRPTPPTSPTPLRQRRAAERTRVLADLMDRRPDLRGVYEPADLAAEAIRWSA